MGFEGREVAISWQLSRFVRADLRSTILQSPEITVDVRKDQRDNDRGETQQVLTLVDIQVATPGEGAFTRFLDIVETHCLLPIYVEGVTKTRLQGFLERRGYKRIPNTRPPDFVRRRTVTPLRAG